MARLPIGIISDHPQVLFPAIRAMRNLIAHDYARADPEIIWASLEQHLPAVMAQVAALMAPAMANRPSVVPQGIALAVGPVGQERPDELGERIAGRQVHPMTAR